MVATVLRLRYRILGNTLARRPWQLVGFCFGILWALGILGSVITGLVAIAVFQSLDVARAVAVTGGSALLLGWVLGPVLVTGMDTTVDADKLAPFPLTTRQVMLALAATGLTGIPGIATSIAALATVALWVRWPVAALVAVPCLALAVLTCVVASRLVSALSTGLGGNRRGRELVGTVVLVLLIMSGPIITGTLALLGSARDLGEQVWQIAGVLSWTPIGATWAVPGDVAAGAWGSAALKLLIALATLGVLWMLWARALHGATTAPRQRAAKVARSGALGLFGRMPTGGVGATWARSLTAWLRDPRYLRQLLVVPLFPLLFAFTGGIDGFMFSSSAILVAFVLCLAGYTDVSYDGTAFASVLATGIRGRDDRLGRALGAASIGIPLVVLVAVVTTAVGGRSAELPAILGAALGLLLGGYGVSAVSSALIVSPVAAPGDSPFKSVPGQTFLTGLLVFVVMGACLVLGAPAIAFAIAGLVTGAPLWGWVALAVGIGVGGGAAALGVWLGGRALDRSGPDLLQRIKAFPTT
ncbi:hypothetical protein [Microbacterium hominis]|uniref:hypothetical protein n=1 Tax=Microbacterium hominis TaxID=162426 RepID=UPI00077C7401|nr:hypothetical protein [Microbacterium hominis]